MYARVTTVQGAPEQLDAGLDAIRGACLRARSVAN